MSRSPEECTTMAHVRSEIDRLDEELMALFAERFGYIDRAAQVKGPIGLEARINSRVEEVVANVRSHAEKHELDPQIYEALWRALIDHSIAHEEKFLGTSNSVSE